MRHGTGWVVGAPQYTVVRTIRCPICLRAREVDRHLGDTRLTTCAATCHARRAQRIYDLVCQDAIWGSWAGSWARTEQIDEDIMVHLSATQDGRRRRDASARAGRGGDERGHQVPRTIAMAL